KGRTATSAGNRGGRCRSSTCRTDDSGCNGFWNGADGDWRQRGWCSGSASWPCGHRWPTRVNLCHAHDPAIDLRDSPGKSVHPISFAESYGSSEFVLRRECGSGAKTMRTVSKVGSVILFLRFVLPTTAAAQTIELVPVVQKSVSRMIDLP